MSLYTRGRSEIKVNFKSSGTFYYNYIIFILQSCRYHQDEETPAYMTNKCNLPCNINFQDDELIPSNKGIVRFKEPYEK